MVTIPDYNSIDKLAYPIIRRLKTACEKGRNRLIPVNLITFLLEMGNRKETVSEQSEHEMIGRFTCGISAAYGFRQRFESLNA
jgi:hypothetical protein